MSGPGCTGCVFLECINHHTINMKQTLLLSLSMVIFSAAFAQLNQWTWMSGDNNTNQYGVYGVKGVASAANKPGARQDAVSWTDASGNLWLFGGRGLGRSSNGYLNDLWKYSPATGLWTWMSGNDAADQPGVYGVKGVASPANKPRVRMEAVGWADAAGNLWLWGGYSYPTASGAGQLSDLWKYSIATNEWTWMSGDMLTGGFQFGRYGVRGIPDPANYPPSKAGATGGIDAAGNLWMFGGTSYSDLWKYTPSSGQWTWMSGDTVPFVKAVYGTKGVANAANNPGTRIRAYGWITASGDFWLFGGQLYYDYPSSIDRSMDDLWKWDHSTGLWTWMSGDNFPFSYGIYGTQGVPAPNNRPGSRQRFITRTEASGNLLLFAGEGTASGSGIFNDLWEYSPASGQWTWLKGDPTTYSAPSYGTKGESASTNKPGARYSPVGWLDLSGNLWVFGGTSITASGTGISNDLWRYTLLKSVSTCPADITIAAASCTGKATVQWAEPRDTFPATISLPSSLDPTTGMLTFVGALRGHGYYRSDKSYLWPAAKDISHYLGSQDVNGHLVTITSEEENSFVLANKGAGIEPWIGLYSPDKNSMFKWVTGETAAYTKWAPGEPNNYGGNQRTMVEPYGQLYNSGSWNDQRSGYFPFITEFEEPLIRYRQLSGPANGSAQSPGVYMICYERTNAITDLRDTCCFSVTVTCPPSAESGTGTTALLTGKATGVTSDKANNGLKAIAFPNPSSNQFTVNIRSGNKEKASLQIIDIAGKLVETKEGLLPNQNVEVGGNLKAGVYFIKIKQGASTTELKIIKRMH